VLVFVRFDSFGSLLAAIGLPQFAPALTAPFMWSSAVVIAGILIFTALFGRVYCSVICPLGLVQDLMLRLRRLIGKTGYRTLPSLAVLHAIVAAMVGGTWLAGYMLPTALLEPFAAGGRIFAGVFQPLAAVLFKYKSSFFGDSVNWLGMASLKPFDVAGTAIVVAMTLLLFILCWRWGRVYCNSLCPVGAVLRMIAGHSMVKVVIDTEKCVSCGVCEKICKAGCIDAATKTIDNSRCIACFNCLDSCRLSGILLKAGANKHTKPQHQPRTGAGPLSAVWQRRRPGIFCRSSSSQRRLRIRFCHRAPVTIKISAVAAFRVISALPPVPHRSSDLPRPALDCAACSSHRWFSISACASRTAISVRRYAQ
ncbi:MAG TPA: 4Fe-4S binding protein, partial [Candidatus Rifleibacterium sp.]|nr:4Fe-4S binding protein [Candidatus Rifleibacterium sp.]